MLINFSFTLLWNESKWHGNLATNKIEYNAEKKKKRCFDSVRKRKQMNRIHFSLNQRVTFLHDVLYFPCNHSRHMLIGFASSMMKKKMGQNLFNFSIYAQKKVNGSFFPSSFAGLFQEYNWIFDWKLLTLTVPKDVCFPFLFLKFFEKEIWNGRKITKPIVTRQCINSIYYAQRQFNWCTSTRSIHFLVKVSWNWFP